MKVKEMLKLLAGMDLESEVVVLNGWGYCIGMTQPINYVEVQRLPARSEAVIYTSKEK